MSREWGFSVWAHNQCLLNIVRGWTARVPGARDLYNVLQGTVGGATEYTGAVYQAFVATGFRGQIERFNVFRGIDIVLKNGLGIECKNWPNWIYRSQPTIDAWVQTTKNQINRYVDAGRRVHVCFAQQPPPALVTFFNNLKATKPTLFNWEILPIQWL